MKKISLMAFSLVLILMFTLILQTNSIYAAGVISLTDLPGGGKTIIIGDYGYSKEYLKYNQGVISNALAQGKKIYIKLGNEIYVDETGFLVDFNILSGIQIDKYFNTDVFEVIDIY